MNLILNILRVNDNNYNFTNSKIILFDNGKKNKFNLKSKTKIKILS